MLLFRIQNQWHRMVMEFDSLGENIKGETQSMRGTVRIFHLFVHNLQS